MEKTLLDRYGLLSLQHYISIFFRHILNETKRICLLYFWSKINQRFLSSRLPMFEEITIERNSIGGQHLSL